MITVQEQEKLSEIANRVQAFGNAYANIDLRVRGLQAEGYVYGVARLYGNAPSDLHFLLDLVKRLAKGD